MTKKSTRQVALSRAGEGEEVILGAPHIGRFIACVRANQLVEPGQSLGTLRVLKKSVEVIAPEGISGRVTLARTQREVAVAYGDPLMTLTLATATDAPGAVAAVATHGITLAEGESTFDAPTDGLFYRSPSPEDPVFKEPGDTVAPGDTIGLIEVMKFFYPVTYEGLHEGTIARFLVDDATPVLGGQPLVVIAKG